MKSFNKKNIITAVILIVFAVISRMVMHGQNYETLTATTVLAGALLGPYLGLLVGLGSVIGTDMFIGNSMIFAYTWSAWAVIGLSNALWSKKVVKTAIWKNSAILTGSGIISVIFFYLWTNFGVWQMGWYSYTFSGLMQCYVAALPFLRNQLVGNLITLPVVVTVGIITYRYLPEVLKNIWQLRKKTLPKIH
jgi:hypothetical protein